MAVQIALAPMEGLLDYKLRAALTRLGGVDWCVTEFVRVTSTLLPCKYYTRVAPELLAGAATPSGVPLHVQLLGSDPAQLAANAVQAAALGAPVIDLNFGCPAKTVNRHRGGAILLDEPELLHAIVRAVRQALPAAIPVTAKMRLGVQDAGRAIECAQALSSGGAHRLVVHARTKTDGYKPPAHWPWIARIAAAVPIPVLANGEIWTVADYHRCVAESGMTNIMLGRGMIARPSLAAEIRAGYHAAEPMLAWAGLFPVVEGYWQHVQATAQAPHAAGRLKQWLGYLMRTYPEAQTLFATLRRASQPEEVTRLLQAATPEGCARHG
jgi:tRNA-dihydrouridine synthase C